MRVVSGTVHWLMFQTGTARLIEPCTVGAMWSEGSVDGDACLLIVSMLLC